MGDSICDNEWSQYVGTPPVDGFMRLVSGHMSPKIGHVPELWVLLLWNAPYVHLSKAAGLMRQYFLKLTPHRGVRAALPQSNHPHGSS